MLVKICGITSKEAAKAAADGGADLIGFVFAESKRKISPADALEIANTIPASVKKVGVFVNETVDNMNRIAELVGLDAIQLHGEESAEIAKQLPYEIIKAFPADKAVFEELEQYPCDYYLLDTPSEKSRGGSGTVFDWSLLEDRELNHNRMILAGGLTPENVKAGIEKVFPAAVDVSSGVETDGKKDTSKIKQFITNAKEARKDEAI